MGFAGGCAEHAGHRGAAPAAQAESGTVSVDEKTGFVSLTSLRGQTPDPQQALAEIRPIYFQHHAPDHPERSRARHRAAQEPADRRGAREGVRVYGWSGINAIRLGPP